MAKNNDLQVIAANDSFSDKPEDLMRIVREQNPELQPEDAFVVPTWFAGQERWFEDPAKSDSAVYNCPLLLRIRGPLDEGALRLSLNEIVRRHGVLRSVFRIIERRLVQIVLPPSEFSLPIIHLDGLAEARELQMQEAARIEAMRPFDLARDSIIRGKLMCLQTDEHVLQLTTHTIVYDDWSTGVLIRELSKLYGGFVAETSPPLNGSLGFQFGDYVRWLRERLQGEEFKTHLAFWEEKLKSAPGFEHLRTDFARPTINDNAGAKQTIILPVEQADILKKLSRRERVSLFMVLLTGFKCLLHRYSGHEEIGVASCAANRPLEEVEKLIGRFGNTMLLRTNLSGNPTFKELLKRVQEVTLKALSHLEVPFGMLSVSIPWGDNQRRNPPFQVMFTLQNAPKEKWQLPGLSVDWLPVETGTSKLDLIVWLKIEPELEITLEYSTQLFSSSTMARLLADYQAILEAMAKNPEARVSNIRIAKRETVGAKPPPMTVPGVSGEEWDKASVQDRMIKLWESAFKPRPIDTTKNFFELGGDSLLAVRLLSEINKTFQRAMPVSVLFGAPTIRELVNLICIPASSSPSSLVSVQPNGTRPPLFCVHGSGGEPVYCWELSCFLGNDQPVYGLRSRGACGEPIQRTVPEMAAHYVEIIRKVQPNGQYYLGGFCFGGMVAYEMARLLKVQGQNVALLVMFDAPAPGSLGSLNSLKNRIRQDLGQLRSLGMLPRLKTLGVKSSRLALRVFRDSQVPLRGSLSKASKESTEPMDRGLLSISDANVTAAKAYHPGPYAGRITLFSTRQGTANFGDGLRERWVPFALGGIEHHNVDGTHLGQFTAPFVTTLAEKLKRSIDRASDYARISLNRQPLEIGQYSRAHEGAKNQGKLAPFRWILPQ
jgi:thioesterase domain-containing protein/acyl carrier protein